MSPRAERLRAAVGNILFLAVLVGAVYASWMWGPKFSVVLSESMQPTYVPGDALIVVPWGSPEVGDVIQFSAALSPSHPDTIITVAHRIVDQDERGFITQGDNPSSNEDYWRVTPDIIDGYVVGGLPQTWMFRISAILIGFAVLMFLWPAAEEEEEEDEEVAR